MCAGGVGRLPSGYGGGGGGVTGAPPPLDDDVNNGELHGRRLPRVVRLEVRLRDSRSIRQLHLLLAT